MKGSCGINFSLHVRAKFLGYDLVDGVAGEFNEQAYV